MRKPAPKTAGQGDFAPSPQVFGSVLFLVIAWITVITLQGYTSSQIAHYAAVGVGIALVASLAVDMREGFINLVRPDIMAILALYFLTLFEFLSNQPEFDGMSGPASVRAGIVACVMGLSGLVIGRHLPNVRKHPLKQLFITPVPHSLLITAFVLFLFIGSLHMLLAVNFNLFTIFEDLIGPRFSQPWGRERFGDWKALLVELSMLFYLIPPMAGIVFARRKNYTFVQLVIVAIGLIMVLFYGFSGGTRNIFLSYVVTFLIAYAFALPRERHKELVALSIVCAVVMLVSTVVMLQFRQFGLRAYAEGGYQQFAGENTFSVDYNLAAIARLIEVFPDRHNYLGWEVPYLAIIRPIPRAIWAGKPEGMSLSIEDALGVNGMTVSATFVGEAYMSHGYIVVFLIGLVFGYATGWWGVLASTKNSELGILIYASGFFSAVISMRSLYVFTTALLPTVASIVIGAIIVKIFRVRSKPKRPPIPPRPARTP